MEAKEKGEAAGSQFNADFQRLYMSQPVESGNFTTPAKEPKNPYRKDTDLHARWLRGYHTTAYIWLTA